MRNTLYCRCAITLLVTLASHGAFAQDSSDAWVTGTQAPQYFAVVVGDVDESVKWYRIAFGLNELDGARADDGSWRIVNLSNEDLFVEIIRDNRATSVERARGFSKVGLRVPDVRVVADRVAQATKERPRVVDDTTHGMRIVQLRDPDGNIVQLSSLLVPDEAAEGNKIMSQAEQDRRIDYIEFRTTDMEKTKKFYSESFGWKFTDYGPDYASFEDGRLTGGFHLASEVTAGGPLVVLYSTNLEEVEARVRQSGGKVVKEIFDFPGGRRLHFTDPSGNELAIWSDQ